MEQKNKETPGSYYFSLFALRNLLTQACLHFARQSNSLLLNMQNVHLLFIITFVCLSVPQTVAYLDAAKFSIKLFSLIYFPASVVRRLEEIEKFNVTLVP